MPIPSTCVISYRLHSKFFAPGDMPLCVGSSVSPGRHTLIFLAPKTCTLPSGPTFPVPSAHLSSVRALPPGFQLDTEEGAFLLPGFVEAVLGLQAGQAKAFDLVFPDTWQQESLRGVKARFSVSPPGAVSGRAS